MFTDHDRAHQRIERIVQESIDKVGHIEAVEDVRDQKYTACQAILIDAAVEHEKFFGPQRGWDPK